MSGTLYLCATPIGNLSDVTDRLGKVLRSVDVVYAEDTRRTLTLTRYLGSDRPVRSYFIGNENFRATEIAERLAAGESVALVSDAGMPSVADPGVSAVQAAAEVGAVVTVIPGPSAVTSAVALSGFGGDRFCFEGFLPRKGGDRTRRASEIGAELRTVVIFCSPKRLVADLELLRSNVGDDRQICVCRELTKQFEEVWRGTLAEAVNHWQSVVPRGEFTVVLDGAPSTVELTLDEAVDEARELVKAGHTKSEAAKVVARSSGITKRSIYDNLI